MKKRIKKKRQTVIDASGVKQIAEMQRYIDNLENFLYHVMMYVKGLEKEPKILKFTERDSITELSNDIIWKFVMSIKEKQSPSDEKIVAQAKEEGLRVGVEAFSELARKAPGTLSAYEMGYIDGAVWCREVISKG